MEFISSVVTEMMVLCGYLLVLLTLLMMDIFHFSKEWGQVLNAKPIPVILITVHGKSVSREHSISIMAKENLLRQVLKHKFLQKGDKRIM